MSKTENKLTTAERISDREFVITRTVNGPAHLVFRAWSDPELFRRWWTPKSFGMTILSCEMDVRTGGSYRLVISHPSMEQPMAFFGRYIEVVPNARIVWTNEEGDGEGAVTTVTFEERDGRTLVVWRDLYPSKEALDEAMISGATSGFGEQFEQLEALLADHTQAG
ncbi:SRPBCC family protein [Asticcacaulis taihuensis]|jgi:uncharacterized protein YndB with AHSA1/START domain|uniref:SRPBCC family protein n=1 Tax=Asticcacaulis taihuensis TaxID=260084 RepID=UPI0026EFD6AE|nr:SRPBCC family protein [Asticcacaulis taihuensis]